MTRQELTMVKLKLYQVIMAVIMWMVLQPCMMIIDIKLISWYNIRAKVM